MAKPVLRVFLGLFKCDQVFDETKHEYIYSNLQEDAKNGKFSTRKHDFDEGFENHPNRFINFDVANGFIIARFFLLSSIPPYSPPLAYLH